MDKVIVDYGTHIGVVHLKPSETYCAPTVWDERKQGKLPDDHPLLVQAKADLEALIAAKKAQEEKEQAKTEAIAQQLTTVDVTEVNKKLEDLISRLVEKGVL